MWQLNMKDKYVNIIKHIKYWWAKKFVKNIQILIFINIQQLKHFLIPSFPPLINAIMSGSTNCGCIQSVLRFHLLQFFVSAWWNEVTKKKEVILFYNYVFLNKFPIILGLTLLQTYFLIFNSPCNLLWYDSSYFIMNLIMKYKTGLCKN